MSYLKLHPSKPAKTLFAGHRAPPAHHRDPRSITVREAARLQSFPDGFAFAGAMNAAFRQIGNAVPPLLGLAVARVVREQLDEAAQLADQTDDRQVA